MNEDQKELTLDESLAEVMQNLPPVIRTYLTQGKYTPVAKDLAAKYKLSPDQGSVLEREIILLLMGVETPDEFTKALAEELHLDQASVDGIAQDINTQIFIPLRNENDAAKPAVPQPPVPVPQPPKPVSNFNLQNKIPLPVSGAPLPPKFMLPSREAAALKLSSVQPDAAMMPVVQPAPEALLPVAPAASAPITLQAAVAAAIAPRVIAPVVLPQNLPGAMPPINTAEIEKTHPIQPVVPIAPVAAPVPPATQPGLPVLGKPLPSDPYREPIDQV